MKCISETHQFDVLKKRQTTNIKMTGFPPFHFKQTKNVVCVINHQQPSSLSGFKIGTQTIKTHYINSQIIEKQKQKELKLNSYSWRNMFCCKYPRKFYTFQVNGRRFAHIRRSDLYKVLRRIREILFMPSSSASPASSSSPEMKW